jgi:hypothetical protein
MFPTRESRFRTALRRSLDAAIEFATLGEYGWSAAWEGPNEAAAFDSRGGDQSDRRRPFSLTATADAGGGTAVAERPTAALVQPASAAGRARHDAETRDTAWCAGQPLRGRVLTPQLPRPARSRDGMAPREQRCPADAS